MFVEVSVNDEWVGDTCPLCQSKYRVSKTLQDVGCGDKMSVSTPVKSVFDFTFDEPENYHMYLCKCVTGHIFYTHLYLVNDDLVIRRYVFYEDYNDLDNCEKDF